MAIDPLQIEAKLIEERTRPLEFDIAGQIKAGAFAGEAFAGGIRKDVQRQKAADFEKLLQSKEQGLLQFIEEAEAKGFDMDQFKPQVDISLKSKDTIASLLNKMSESIAKQTKAREVEKTITAPTELERTQAAVRAGIGKPKAVEAAFETQRQIEKAPKIQEAISKIELVDEKGEPRGVSEILVDLGPEERELFFDSKNQEFDPVFEKVIDSIKDKAKNSLAFDKWLLQQKKFQKTLDKDQVNRLDKYNKTVKDTPFVADMTNQFMDEMRDAGYTGETIFDITGVGDLKGQGAGLKRIKTLFLDEKSTKTRSLISWMSMVVRHEFFGAALTEQEKTSFDEAMGNKTITNEFALITAIQKIAKRSQFKLRQGELLLQDADFPLLKKNKLIRADDVGRGTGRKSPSKLGPKTKVTEVERPTKNSTNAEIAAWLKSKKMKSEIADIKRTRGLLEQGVE